MKLIYTPVGGESREFIFKPQEMLSIDAEAIEDVGGETWGNFREFCEALTEWKLKAKRAALWIMLRRDKPKLRFVELVVGVNEIGLEWDDDEIERFQAAAEASEDSEEKAALVAMLDALGKARSSATSEEPSDDADSTSPMQDSEA